MEYFHLTTPQQNIWNLQKYYSDTAIANLCGAVFFQERRNGAFLCKAVCQFIRSQSGIRLRFHEGEEPWQYVSKEVDDNIPVRTFLSMKEFDTYAKRWAKEPIGLTECKMYRFEVFHLEEENRSGILAALSHLISDAWTFGLMANQLDAAYRRLAGEEEAALLEGDYTDFIWSEDVYRASKQYEKDKHYWEEKYSVGSEECPVKLRTVSTDSIKAERIMRVLPSSLEQDIAVYCRSRQVTEAVLFEMALVIYLSRINPDIQTVTVGVPVLNRRNVREKEIAGMFVSTMPLTVTVEKDTEIGELARQITRGHMDLFRHQKYPYESILRQLRRKQDFSGNLYDVMISYQNAKTRTGADTKWYSNGCSEVPLVIHIDNRDGKECHTLNVDYQTAVFRDRMEVELLIDRLEYILGQITAGSIKRVGEIRIVPPKEYNRVVYEYNDTYVEYSKEKCIHELFVEQAAKTPERIALVFEDQKFTYRQLDMMSNSLAYYLKEKGVNPGDVVPIIAKRSWHIIVAMLGVLKAGGAYMPISPEIPSSRIQYMLETASVKLAVIYGYSEGRDRLKKCRSGIEMISLEEVDYFAEISPVKNKNQIEDLCYIIFTSGSTGEPKGVAINHRNVLNYCHKNNKNVCHRVISDENKSIISVTNIVFDIFVTESLLPLVNGLTIYLANDEEIMSQNKLAKLIKNNKIDVIQTTPTKMKSYMLEYNNLDYLSVLKTVILGGEVFPEALYQDIAAYSKARVFNIYGPAETTVWSANKEIKDEKRLALWNAAGDFKADITIGSPIANTQIYILDKAGYPLPVGVAGELCISGDGVGNGYLNRPEITEEKFVLNPFASEENHHGKVMYHTGDLAYWRTDGEIEYLGRIDTQVKIRGLRIELGEIESMMGSFPEIQLAAVANKRDKNNRQYLVGYYTAESGIDEKALRVYLSAKLPKYMIPNYFMCLKTIPMTASGKTDRKNLPVPDFTKQAAEYISPETDMEKRLAKIWQELFQIEYVGRTDDFFELGGDSLLAIAMVSEIEKCFHVEFSIKEIMENSEMAELARCLEDACRISDVSDNGGGNDGLVDEKETVGEVVHSFGSGWGTAEHMMGERILAKRIIAHHSRRYPLLPQQKAVYAACMKEPDTLVYNMPTKINLPDWVDRERLKESITRVFDRHKLLKSSIRLEETGLFGVYDENAHIMFEEYEKGKEDVFVRPFDLGKAPFVRAGFTEDALLLDIHHIIADGASVNILLREIATVYEGGVLPEQEAEYLDYAEYFYGLDITEHKAYFQKMLKCDWEPVILPGTKKPGKGGESRMYQIPEDVFVAARKYARKNGLTDTMVFLGVYGILLSRYTGRKEILSSIILQNRTHRDTKNMVGMFVNTLPVSFSLGNSVAEYMEEVKEKVLGLFRYQALPFEDISEAVGTDDRSAVNTSFVYQGDGEKALSLEGQELLSGFMDTHRAKFDLSMELTPAGNGCRIRLEYNKEKYDGQLMDALAEGYIRIVGQLEKEKLSEISVLSEEEYHRIVEEFNDTYVKIPEEKCVHELFMEQAAKTPERVALVFEDRKFTYRQLDEMSNSLAHCLREKGAGPGDVVAIIARRSWYVIVAMLGVLKAGGAYMPVDPDYPEERIKYALEIARSRLALVYEYDKELGIETIRLDGHVFWKNTETVRNVNSPEDSAYVIFTSGSMGKPKGVAICHHNVCNYADGNAFNSVCQKLLDQQCQSIVSVTNIGFDIFVTESLLSLVNGLCVFFASDEEVVSPSRINRLVKENRIDVLQTTPTKMRSYLLDRHNTGYLKGLKTIILGGEAFPEELYHTLRNLTDADIYNIYGPAETTVWSTNVKVTSPDITIGTPIANTQIYIVDGDRRPVPIGVPGELCIAGEGVGKGYLNRPELTAERFVPNPFATSENHHGKIMYRTGDLARLRSDGQIEYLGRMDNQVKIRGLRIELGEIESVMGSFAGIGLCAAADKRDETGRQYLVGYYTLNTESEGQSGTGNGKANRGLDLNEKALRAYLSARLPRYMVPNYFMRLEAMPMTASGKTDRRSLPEPDFVRLAREYIAPVTEKEKALCCLMEELLHMEQVGVTDDFFELGGDSLTAIELLTRAHDKGIVFPLQKIFDYPTVRQLCGHMRDTDKVHYEPEDFKKYQELLAENVADETFVPKKNPLGNVLLTGATGFLGAHVMDRLFREETGKIYCLVRDGEGTEGRRRLQEILRYYFGERYKTEFTAGLEDSGSVLKEGKSGGEAETKEEYLKRRIIPIVGDIESETLAENMPKDVQTVIHAAASVKHYGSYEYFNRVNVEGTGHIIKYAKAVGARLIHISTLSVSGNSLMDEFAVYRSKEEKFFGETSLYIGQPLDNVYIRSKFEAELTVLDAMLAGLDAKIIRVGNLTSRMADYKFQPNFKQNAFLARFKAILEFGLFPDYLMPLYSEFSPIDLTAEGVVKIAQYAGRQTVFHLNSNRPVSFERFLEIVRELEISAEVVDKDTFNQALHRTLQDQATEYIFQAFQNDMDEQGRLLYDSNIHIRNDFTVWFLKKIGFEWNEIDQEYIQGYVEYFRKIKYLKV